MQQSLLDNIRIVLVNTTHPGNIGATARAIKNMGIHQLYVVEPKLFPHEKAVWRSGHALDVLDNIVVTKTLDEALNGCGFVIGTSARERKIPWPLLNPRDAASIACQEAQNHPVAVVFGREDRGLTNEELQKCHMHLTIPTSDEYSSLNLAAAVQVVCYELRMTAVGDGLDGKGVAASQVKSLDEVRQWEAPAAPIDQMESFYAHLQKVLIDVDYMKADEPRQTMVRLRRIFNRSRLDDVEVKMLRGITKRIERFAQLKNSDES